MPTKTTTQRAHLQSAADLLTAKKANQQEAESKATNAALSGNDKDADRRIYVALAALLLLQRQRTIKASLKALKRELRAVTKAARVAYPTTLDLTGLDGASRADRAYARAAAKGYAKRWKDLRDSAKAGGKTSQSARRAALKGAKARLGSTVTTETARTFSTVRGDAIVRIADAMDEQPHWSDGGLTVARQWFAQLDSCPVCGDYDGMTIPANEFFPDTPGGVHPNCLCIDVLVMVDPSELS